tara:strand:+ start:6269 stop:6559 length:291 start_codon:yes stop_codon:yes gene_type:complete
MDNELRIKQLEAQVAELESEKARLLNVMPSIEEHMEEARAKAIDSLGRYKFSMFGYWSAIWVHLNKISGLKKPSPFKDLVHCARAMEEETDLELVA